MKHIATILTLIKKKLSMEPIPVFYDEIALSAVAIKPKQPFLDWTNALTPDFPQTESQVPFIW